MGGIARIDVPHKNLDLAFRPLCRNEGVVACRDLDPVHTNYLGVNHEPKGVYDIAFEGWNDGAEQVLVRTLSSFEDTCGKIRWSHSASLECTYLEL